MTEQTKENPGAGATATGADIKSEAAKLHNQDTPKPVTFATFFWCRASGSVERFSGYPSGVAV